MRELLTHTAGFVTDDPWGDRQTPLPEDDFTRLLSEGVPFTRPPATAMEYSNLGYALLGRIVANVSRQPYKDFVQRTLFGPLGMTSTGYDVAQAPADRRALGYRWEDDAWKLEPTMAHGAFGAMGGIQTSATDYAKWVAFLLSAWPPRDGADAGPGAGARACASWRRARTSRRCGCGPARAAPTRVAKPPPTPWASSPRPTASSGSR